MWMFTVIMITFERISRSEGLRVPEKYHFNTAISASQGRTRSMGGSHGTA